MKQLNLLLLASLYLLSIGGLKSQTIWTGPDFTFTKVDSADWTLQVNQDRLTSNVWITRQNKAPIYNYKWWQDNLNQDPSTDTIVADFWNDATTSPFTPTGGTKGVRWALLDSTGSSTSWAGYNFGTLGNSTHFYSFNNIIQIIEILETEAGDFSTINVVDDFTVSFGGTDFDFPNVGNYIVGKKFGVWLVDDNIYFTLTFNSWGSNGSGGSFSYTRSTDQLSSINTYELEKNIVIRPNPTSDFIQLSNLKAKKKYSIYNILGTEVKNGFVSNNEQIDVRQFNKGVYFLKFDSKHTVKFIKK